MIFDGFISVLHKHLEPFSFILNVSQYLAISQNNILLTGIYNSFFKGIDIFTENVAATNCILGMVIIFKRARLALPIIRVQ